MFRINPLWLLLLCCIPACAPHDHGHDDHGVHEAIPAVNDTIRMSREMLTLAGVSWQTPELSGLAGGDPLYGVWVLFPEHRALVSGIAPGRVRRLFYALNDEVSRGKALLELESPEWMDLQRRYFAHVTLGVFLRQEYDRLETLQAQDATSGKAWQQIQTEMAQWRAQLAGLEADLRMYGRSPAELDAEGKPFPVYTLTAPVSGRVIQSLASPGQWLNAGEAACELADLGQVMASLQARPGQVAGLKAGDSLLLETEGYLGLIPARISHIDRMADPSSQTVGVHARPLRVGSLPPVGRFVQGRSPGRESAEQLSLPAEAIRKESGGDFILVRLAERGNDREEVFLKVRVTVRQSGPDRVQIDLPPHLSAQAEVVHRGAYYVDAHGKAHEFEHDH